MDTIRFKGDSTTRRRFFVAESFAHPAKMASGLFLECLERYSKPGDVVLDVMAGSGTALLGAMYGREMILVELEGHFCIGMQKSWLKIQQNGPALGYTMGTATIIQGDARNLGDVLADTILTSPPYSETMAHGGGGANADKGLGDGYTRKPVDAIVTSPPFQDQEPFADKKFMLENRKANNSPYGKPVSESRLSPTAYSESNRENVGNQRGDAYWQSMKQIYVECYRVLKPGGILALVLKGFTRDGKYVDLPGQTEALLLEAGWQKHDEWRRELWSLSFWRILQKRRDPAAWDDRLMYESVLAFRKPEGQGNGVDTVITSPPYESSLHEGQAGPGATSDDGAWAEGRERTRGGYVDTVITSPPYEGTVSAEKSGIDENLIASENRRPSKRIYQGEYSYTRKERP